VGPGLATPLLVVIDHNVILLLVKVSLVSNYTSHEERGLVIIEGFLGGAESTVLILDKPMN